MKDKELYAYLGKCIQKYRHPYFSQSELSANICTRYTLSKLESGTLAPNEHIVRALLKKLGMHYANVVDAYIMQSHLKYVMEIIEYQRTPQLESILKTIHALLKRNKNNILFIDYMLLYRFLHTHYVDKKPIHLGKYDFNSLSYLSDAHYSILIHTYCENLIQYQSLKQFQHFYQSLQKQEGSILLDFFKMLFLHLQNNSKETIALYYKNKETLQKDRKTRQLIRYGSIVCLQQLNRNVDKAEKNIRTILRYTPKCDFKNQYFYFLIFVITCIYINKNNFHKAYVTLYNYTIKNSNLMHHALPYLLFLSYQCNEDFDPTSYYFDDILVDACVRYHQFRSNKNTGCSHITFLSKHVLEVLQNYPYNECLLHLITLEKDSQYARRTCNKTAQRFQEKLQKLKH